MILLPLARRLTPSNDLLQSWRSFQELLQAFNMRIKCTHFNVWAWYFKLNVKWYNTYQNILDVELLDLWDYTKIKKPTRLLKFLTDLMGRFKIDGSIINQLCIHMLFRRMQITDNQLIVASIPCLVVRIRTNMRCIDTHREDPVTFCKYRNNHDHLSN